MVYETEKRKSKVCSAQTDSDKGNMPRIIQTTYRKSNRVVFSTVFHSHNRKKEGKAGADEVLCALLMPFLTCLYLNLTWEVICLFVRYTDVGVPSWPMQGCSLLQFHTQPTQV